MSRIAIITARGGSKRIPQKNIKPFCGKPIIAYSIEAALDSELFHEVMVSTDSDEIAAVARQFGAKVPFMRSAAASDDYATTADVLVEVISSYKADGREFEYGCCLYPTAPFITPTKLRKSLEKIRNEGADSLYAVVRFDFPVQRALKIENGRITYVQPEYANTRSQDLTPYYHDCGQFYWFRPKILLGQRTLMTENTSCFEVPESQAYDIDTLEDWKIAEALYACGKSS
jgi:pseudaminic acid cytidylyltransferase